MMRPDAQMHNQDPKYFASLVKSTGMPVTKLAKLIGHDDRTIRRWMSGERSFPYSAQFIVECIVLQP